MNSHEIAERATKAVEVAGALEAGHSPALTQYVAANGRFHKYSLQRPTSYDPMILVGNRGNSRICSCNLLRCRYALGALSHPLTGPHGWIRLFFSFFARSRRPDGQTSVLFVETDIGSAAGVWDVVSRIQQEWSGLN